MVFKPRSTVNSYFQVVVPKEDENLPEAEQKAQKQEIVRLRNLQKEIASKIPDPLFGKEASLQEVIDGVPDNGWDAHPELRQQKYADWLQVAEKLEGMTRTYGIHAGGVILSNEPVHDFIPLWMKRDKEIQPNGKNKTIEKHITQYDMHEVAELGGIKYDFLATDNLSIIRECVELIEQNHGIKIEPYKIEDGDQRAFQILEAGLVKGLFQMETSESAKNLIADVKPRSIEDLSAISSLNRPGPLSAGFDKMYVENKNNNYAPETMPTALANLLQESYWTILYQEQLMNMCTELAGFSLRESDEIRRALG